LITASGGLDAAESAALAAAIQQVLTDEAAAGAVGDPLPAAYRSRWARAGRAAAVQAPPLVSGDGLDWRGVAGG
jgi:hypothetical protein